MRKHAVLNATPTQHSQQTRSMYSVYRIALPNPDLGRIEVFNGPDAEFAFRVPGLRNVALSAPYMHNGAFLTLEEVVQFYADGGGLDAGGVDVQVDEKLRGFDLTDQEAQDLVAFLYALTDEPSDLITIPESVPSGLPVIQAQENAVRDANRNIDCCRHMKLEKRVNLVLLRSHQI